MEVFVGVAKRRRLAVVSSSTALNWTAPTGLVACYPSTVSSPSRAERFATTASVCGVKHDASLALGLCANVSSLVMDAKRECTRLSSQVEGFDYPTSSLQPHSSKSDKRYRQSRLAYAVRFIPSFTSPADFCRASFAQKRTLVSFPLFDCCADKMSPPPFFSASSTTTPLTLTTTLTPSLSVQPAVERKLPTVHSPNTSSLSSVLPLHESLLCDEGSSPASQTQPSAIETLIPSPFVSSDQWRHLSAERSASKLDAPFFFFLPPPVSTSPWLSSCSRSLGETLSSATSCSLWLQKCSLLRSSQLRRKMRLEAERHGTDELRCGWLTAIRIKQYNQVRNKPNLRRREVGMYWKHYKSKWKRLKKRRSYL